ncbi:hypothetical protein DVH05_028657 [Phytophthora capsici]|nr:hypothetical protein DVH05_028657 [Phytophthora capsici]
MYLLLHPSVCLDSFRWTRTSSARRLRTFDAVCTASTALCVIDGSSRSKGTVCNFSEGDYVLWSRVDKRMQGNKLLVRWVGPFQVVKALPHSFLIRHLLTGAEYDVHGSRLKFYHDADLEVTAEIREHVSLQGIILEVREVVDHRFNSDSGELELLVAWRGLQDIENSWEPAHSIRRDVPALVTKYATDHSVDELL